MRHRLAGQIAAGLGTFLILWIIAQVLWMEIHWLHVLYIIIGVVELVLGLIFKKTLDINKNNNV